MLKEINEQPDIVRNLLTEYMPSPEAEVRLGGIDLEQLFRGINRIEIIACGTSLHAAKIAQNAFETLAEFRCGLRQPANIFINAS